MELEERRRKLVESSVLHQTQSCGQGELQMRFRNESKEILFTDVAVRRCHLRKMSDAYTV